MIIKRTTRAKVPKCENELIRFCKCHSKCLNLFHDMTDSAPSVRNDAVKNHCTAHDRKWRKSPMGARFVRQEKAKAYLGEDRGCKRISVIR